MSKHAENSKVAASARKARARNVRLAKALVGVVAVCLAFVGGFLVRGDAPLLDALGMSPEGSDASKKAGLPSSGDAYGSLGARVGEVEDVIAEDSLDFFDLDEATSGVLEAFSEATADPYLRYYDANRYAALVKESSGDYGGVGVLFSEYNGRAYAVDVFEGSAAQAADVRQGDFVVAIDGDRSHDWTVTEVTSALRRDEGEDVVITWRRAATLDDEGGEEFTTTLECSDFTVRNVETELTGTVGYIRLKQITQNAASLVEDAVQDLEAQGALSFVLDIRDNPGGYLTQAVDVASLFVKSGTIVKIQTKEAEETTKNATGSVATDKPLVVLVTGNTAASAEVLAAALRDNQRATLVGTTTLGKGSVQITRELSFGGALRYTAAYYRSPLGRDIDGVGVTPDVAVSLSEGGDNQKALAVETAQSLARG